MQSRKLLLVCIFNYLFKSNAIIQERLISTYCSNEFIMLNTYHRICSWLDEFNSYLPYTYESALLDCPPNYELSNRLSQMNQSKLLTNYSVNFNCNGTRKFWIQSLSSNIINLNANKTFSFTTGGINDKLDHFLCRKCGVDETWVNGKCVNCPSTWKLNGTYCYQHKSVAKNWTEAKNDCRLINSSLVYLRSDEDFNFFKSVRLELTQDFWTGLRIKPSNETYWEYDNSIFFNDSWYIARNDENIVQESCGRFGNNSVGAGFLDRNCSFGFSYVCVNYI